ncbi:MAG TPA: helix-turn-helix domain-containing protein [Gammaproteobacteria bacterium]
MKKSRSKRRSACPIANSLDILGDRWSLVIIRDLMFRGKREYGELLDSEEGVSTSVLAARLEHLQCAGIVTKTGHPDDLKKFRYHLTEKGIDLLPLMIELVLWGTQYVPNTSAPPEILKAMKKDREEFMRRVKQELKKGLPA